MELIFLGTSSGTPTKTRNVSATALRMKDSKDWYLVDCGEGTQHQILKTKLSLLKLKAICITHIHGDHCYGLPGLLASASLDGRKEPLTIIAPSNIKKLIETVQNFTQLNLSFEIKFIDVENVAGSTITDDFEIKITELSHRTASYAYAFVEKNIEATLDKDKLIANSILPSPVWGQLQNNQNVTLDDGRELKSKDYLFYTRSPRSIVVCGDNDSPELLKNISPVPDVMVHESTYTEEILLKVGPEPQHSSAKRVSEFTQEMGIKNLVLTHFSARFGPDSSNSPSIADVKNEALKYYSSNLFLANDFDVYWLNKDRNLSLL